MIWLWLGVLWLVVACTLGVGLGLVLRAAERNEDARHRVDDALERELAEL